MYSESAPGNMCGNNILSYKTGQNNNPIFFKKLASQKSICDYLKIFKTYSTSSLTHWFHKKI